MAVAFNNPESVQQFKVLLIGNNPIELSSIYEHLVKLKDKNFITEIAFDVKTILQNKLKSKPSFILIDDNIGKLQIKMIIKALSRKRDTENIPITILKNSNSGDSAEGVHEYLLKNAADRDSIYKALLNSLKLKKSHDFLKRTYYRNKSFFETTFG